MKKPLFNKICIIGVGLIGGSVGLAVKKRKLAKWVIGVSRKDSTLKEAVSLGAIDIGTKKLKDAVEDADLVILCTPVYTIAQQFKTIKPFLKKGALVVDTGSSKLEIQRAADKVLPKGVFVGCHPMAGSQKTGVRYAEPDLFCGSVCFVAASNAIINRFWKSLEAQPILTDPKTHDAWVAKASHLPHVLSFALFQSFAWKRATAANPSIRDMARLSKSDPELWADILLSNQKNLVPSLKSLSQSLQAWTRALQSKKRSQLVQFIRSANKRSFDAFDE